MTPAPSSPLKPANTILAGRLSFGLVWFGKSTFIWFGLVSRLSFSSVWFVSLAWVGLVLTSKFSN